MHYVKSVILIRLLLGFKERKPLIIQCAKTTLTVVSSSAELRLGDRHIVMSISFGTLSWKEVFFSVHVTQLTLSDKIMVRELSHLLGKEQMSAMLHVLAFVTILRPEQA